MSHLMIDEQLLSKIREKSKTDLALKGPLLPPGLIYSEIDNLYYFGDKYMFLMILNLLIQLFMNSMKQMVILTMFEL